ncbi:hypothetical protein [uncultured Alteromonas sp.]|jgi:hypothetical protein|uniref:hypothetical protein n=1 Tax=uncultured Alteromonas sp. TaxID=179113 RepID=UPI0030D5A27F|tara:strand:- start:49434 stop:49595 length:162 start_codon:yes stop_codon:yes gene_type:complete
MSELLTFRFLGKELFVDRVSIMVGFDSDSMLSCFISWLSRKSAQANETVELDL